MSEHRSEPSPFDAVRQVADAVLYEGYVLYPYRASSRKNQSRWQFGVLMPPAYVAADPSERSACQTEIVFEAKADAVLRIQLRFLHIQHRTGGDLPEWDETVERQLEFDIPVMRLLDRGYEAAAAVADGQAPLIDAHGMEPGSILKMLGSLGGQVSKVLVVACEPESLEDGLGLSQPVLAAVPWAIALVEQVMHSDPISAKEVSR